jgi:hypothetical protein
LLEASFAQHWHKVNKIKKLFLIGRMIYILANQNGVHFYRKSWPLRLSFAYHLGVMKEKDGRVVVAERRASSLSNQENVKVDSMLHERNDVVDGGSLTLCICRQGYDPKRFMIECSHCDRWFHGNCVQMTEERAFSITHYACPSCQNQGAHIKCNV